MEFVQFWLDTIIEWESEHKRDVIVALSATKDVQDAILADPERSKHVDVIDIRYWTYDKNFKLYAPPGGANLAPRQHLRQLQPEASSFASIVKAVREMRVAHPDKAVTYYADQNCRSSSDGWAVLMGGGSLANLKLPDELAKALVGMSPADGVVGGQDAWCLAGDGNYLIYTETGQNLPLKIPQGKYLVRWLDIKTGELSSGERISGGEIVLTMRNPVVWLEQSLAVR